MSARKSAAQVSAAKQKKIAIGGAVLLVGILVIQGPKMLKLVSGGSSSPPAAAAVAPPVTPGAVPGAPTPTPTPVSAAPQTTGTKFVSFETFGTKDPFAPQINPNAASAAVVKKVTPAVGVTGSSATSGSAATPTSTTSSTTGTTAPTTSSAGSTAKPSFKVAGGTTSTATATIAVNSKRQVVTVNHDFPTGDPVFTLVSVGPNAASIAIAGGSLKTGGKTFALTVGTPTTLLNTATGKKYKLELLSTAPSGA